jgi:hypothetical protein
MLNDVDMIVARALLVADACMSLVLLVVCNTFSSFVVSRFAVGGVFEMFEINARRSCFS